MLKPAAYWLLPSRLIGSAANSGVARGAARGSMMSMVGATSGAVSLPSASKVIAVTRPVAGAWGSYQSPANPVLRDTTERVIIASKGRFDRVGRGSAATGEPGIATIPGDEFMEATLDVWEIPAESATRVGHPAPFPVALVERCIQLLTYRGDVVLDPFMGSGTTAVAAVNTGRRYVGYDTDAGYVRQARERIASMVPGVAGDRRTLKDMARAVLDEAGYHDIEEGARIAPGVTVSFRATAPDGAVRLFELGGVHTPARPGLARIDNVWRTIAKAAVAHEVAPASDFIVLTSGSVRGGPLAAVVGADRPITAVVDLAAADATVRLLSIHER